jgi:hypothetical protein
MAIGSMYFVFDIAKTLIGERRRWRNPGPNCRYQPLPRIGGGTSTSGQALVH